MCPFGLAFASAPPTIWLNLTKEGNSPARSTKSTPSLIHARHKAMHHRALTACKHMVSGSISFPSRGAFHLSLTVLVHYRSLGYLALESGLPRFPSGTSCPMVLKHNPTVSIVSVTGLSPSMVGISMRVHLQNEISYCMRLLPRL